MSTRVDGPKGHGQESPTIESRDELARYLEEGSKPESEWHIGTEHEKFGFNVSDNTPVPYEGERGIGALLEAHHNCFGWDAIRENGKIIALSCSDCPIGGSITLEPGGQLELSGAPLKTIHETEAELRQHLSQIGSVGKQLGIGFLGIGFSPKRSLDQTPLVPKDRYRIMMQYMPTRGTNGLNMMFRTATVQVNMDFSDEADMVRKLRVALALQPVATALFASSPFKEGTLNGFQSYRAQMWQDTDPDRTGGLPFAFEEGMGFERYVDYALDVPMYFVYRDGGYIDVAGSSFRDFLAGKLEALPGERPTMEDWADHLTTLFPEVRLKKFLEMRGADAGPLGLLLGLPALWAGLLYDQTALDNAAALIENWTQSERDEMRLAVPMTGLATQFRGGTVQDLAREILTLAEGGLRRRAQFNEQGQDETRMLTPLLEIAETGRTEADRLIAAYQGPWDGDINRLFETEAL
ncbi:MAG: glutamate--cysteine ligase [Pseudomonadota bacterium]